MNDDQLRMQDATYAGTANSGGYGSPSKSLQNGLAARPAVPNLSEEANSGLVAAHELHALLDNLDARLFGPQPCGIDTDAQSKGPPVFADQIRETRQRLESACSRMQSLLGRV